MKKILPFMFSLVVLSMCQLTFADILYSPSTANGTIHRWGWYDSLGIIPEFVDETTYQTHCQTAYLNEYVLPERITNFASKRAVIEFPIAQYSQADIQQATLNLYFYQSTFTTAEVSGLTVFGFNTAGNGQVDSTDRDGSIPLFQTADTSDWQPHWITIDITTLLRQAAQNSYPWIRFNIQADLAEWNDSSDILIGMSEDPAGHAPYLQIIPEPATLTLFLLSAVLLRRKQ
ncbi:MAG: DNRLRE domain-containing protein [Anaerohalosphaeraceae bacterium]